jgi:hypothetical protein
MVDDIVEYAEQLDTCYHWSPTDIPLQSDAHAYCDNLGMSLVSF